MKQTILIALFAAAAAAAATAAEKKAPQKPDICTGAVDPYSPTTQRTLFFQAAGPDNEISEKEFSADWTKAKSAKQGAPAFARRFDRWRSMLAFDKNGNKTIDWFEAHAYRRDIRARVLGAYDKNKDSRLVGKEREAAVAALSAGKVPPKQTDRRLVITGGAKIPKLPLPGRTGSVGGAPVLPGRDAAKSPPPEWMKRFDANKDGRLSTEERRTLIDAIRHRADEKKFFREFDRNGDGEFSDEEKEDAIRAVRERQRAQFLEKHDINGDGKLDEKERAALRAERGGQFRQVLERWKLRDFDADGNGKIDEAEQAEVKAFQQQMQGMGKEFRLRMADMNGDGKVTDEERKAVGQEWRQAGWKMLVKAAKYMDADGDGQVSPEETQAFRQRATTAVLGWMEKFTMRFDADNSGRLDKTERTALIKGIRDEFLERCDKFDADDDGRLNPEEAMKMLEAFGKEIGIEPPPRGASGARPTVKPRRAPEPVRGPN